MSCVFLFVIAAGCTNSPEGGSDNQGSQSDQLQVVTTFYPLYDFTKKIGGEYVHVRNLVPAGADPHQWTPSTSDMVTMSNADLFIYNGAGFEVWTDNFLNTLDGEIVVLEATRDINLLEVDSHAHDDHDHDHDEFDPHVWVSPKRAMLMAENIKNILVQINPEYKEQFLANFEWFMEDLEELDQQFEAVIANSSKDYIVTSHNAFAYLAYDYGFEQRFIMGLSTEAEPTVQHLSEISHFIEEHDVQYILFEALSSSKAAETLAKDLGVETLVFNPLEGLTKEEEEAGEDYLSIMQQNLETIETALKE